MKENKILSDNFATWLFRVLSPLILLVLVGCMVTPSTPSLDESRSSDHKETSSENMLKGLCQYPYSISEKSGQSLNSPVDAEQLLELGSTLYQEKCYPNALKAYRQALEFLSPAHDVMLEADIFYHIGRAQKAQEKYYEALNAYQRALALLEQLGKESERNRGMILNEIGMVYRALGQIDPAREQFVKSLRIRHNLPNRSQEDRLGEVRAQANLASTYFDQGHYVKALELYKNAQHLLNLIKPDQLNEKTAILTHIGALYTDLGQYDKALDYHLKALEIYGKAKDRSGKATTLHNIGYIYEQRHEYSEAITAFQAALDIRRSLGEKFAIAETLNSIGLTWSENNESDKAIRALKEALAIFRDLDALRFVGATLDSLGSLYKEREEYSKALDYYQNSLLIWRQIVDWDGERITLGNIGATFKRQNKPAAAIAFYKQSVNITEQIRSELKLLPKTGQIAYAEKIQETYRNLADLLLTRQSQVPPVNKERHNLPCLTKWLLKNT